MPASQRSFVAISSLFATSAVLIEAWCLKGFDLT